MTKINDLWDGSKDKRKVRSLVPYCGQAGWLSQVPQLSIDTYTHLNMSTKISHQLYQNHPKIVYCSKAGFFGVSKEAYPLKMASITINPLTIYSSF